MSESESRLPVLMTGFEPFLGHEINPSWSALARMLELYPRLSENVRTAMLPVDYRRIEDSLGRALAADSYSAVLCLGMHSGGGHGGRDVATFYAERSACNCDDSTSPDNSGAYRQGTAIDPERPRDARLHSTLDSDAVCAVLRDVGLQCEPSDDAGRYLCNHAFYCALSRAGTYTPVGFLHVPPTREIADGVLTIDQIARGLAALAAGLALGRIGRAPSQPDAGTGVQ